MRTTTDCGFRDSKDISAQDSLLKFGPTLKVDIGLDLDFLSAGSGEPDLPRKGLFALVDTGASECFIDSFLADSLKLPIVGRQNVSGVHGVREVNRYLAQIYVPSLRDIMWGAFAGINFTSGLQSYSAPIGRNFLQRYVMTYSGKTGSVILEKLGK